MNDRYRSVALALAEHVSGTYELIGATDAVLALDAGIPTERPTVTSPDGMATYDWDKGRWVFDHDALVNIALSTPEVMRFLAEGKKIQAIKVLRQTTKCGLKEAKDACEDERVALSANSWPWSDHDSEEPPF